MPRLTPLPTDGDRRTMAPWAPAIRTGGGPRSMLSGARVFAALATLVVLTRRRAT